MDQFSTDKAEKVPADNTPKLGGSFLATDDSVILEATEWQHPTKHLISQSLACTIIHESCFLSHAHIHMFKAGFSATWLLLLGKTEHWNHIKIIKLTDQLHLIHKSSLQALICSLSWLQFKLLSIFSKNHKIPAWQGLKGTYEDHLLQLLC